MAQDALDEVGRHLLNDVDHIVNVQLVHDVVQLLFAERLDQHALLVGVHIREGFRRKLLREQAENKRHFFARQIFEELRHVGRVHLLEERPQRGKFLLFQQF